MNRIIKRIGIILLAISLGAGVVWAQEATEDAERLAGDLRTDEQGVEQVWVPAGCFMMGTSEEQAEYALSLDPPPWARTELPTEQPQHEVCLTQGYWIDRYEVTNAAYQAFIDAGGYTQEAYWSDEGWNWLDNKNVDSLPPTCIETVDDHPRVCITWYEAQAYANWRGGQLPTEAQWEFAARGPDANIYPWGNSWDTTLTNIEDIEGLVPVGSYPDGVSWVGAHDMAGNAMEWVSNWFDADYYELGVRDDPTGPEIGTRKPEKGGWWGSNAFAARSAFHLSEDPPTYQDHHIGVRVVTLE